MERIQPQELAYFFEAELLDRFRSLKVPRAKHVAESIVPKLMQHVPSNAFEGKAAWEAGLVFFHGDVEEAYVKDRQEELAAVHLNIKKEIPITLYLSSFGGECESGMAFVSTIQEIRRAGRPVNVHIQGTAMSMGTVIAQACDLRTIEPFATMMIHEVSSMIYGKTLDAKDQLAFQERYEAVLFGTYAARSGKPVDYWRQKCARRDVYLTAREAVSEGLVDRMRPVAPYPKKSIKKSRASTEEAAP